MSTSNTAQSPNLTALPTAQRYLLHAYSTAARIRFGPIRDAMPSGSTERYSPDCMICHVSRLEQIFVFKFGAVVFFNLPPAEHDRFLTQFGIVARPHTPNPDPDNDELAEDDFTLNIEPNVTQVSFNAITIPEWDMAKLQLVAQILGQSSALEIIEWEVEDFLAESSRLASSLKRLSAVRTSRRELLQFLGEGLNTKHRITGQLALVDDPEKTWEKEDLYKIYLGLWDNFDIDERVQNIEKNLQLCTESTELLLEILNSRQSERLEWIIIILIAFEVVKSFF